jgi:hypothetical protein
VIVVAATLSVAVALGVIFLRQADLPRPSVPMLGRACLVTTEDGSVSLDADQMANAATIAAVGIRRELPSRALVVALAAALQESKLRNLSYGDRDSVGLFQQRPSQNWGTPKQIRDPRYAAGRFYDALVKVRNWKKLRVTEAAQRVQRSAFPEAYQQWADEAEVLTAALNGSASGAVACTVLDQPTRRGTDAARALDESFRLDWGDSAAVAAAEATGVVLAVRSEQIGWRYAHWLVAHATDRGVESVQFGTRLWTARGGGWVTVEARGPAAGERVIAEVFTGG